VSVSESVASTITAHSEEDFSSEDEDNGEDNDDSSDTASVPSPASHHAAMDIDGNNKYIQLNKLRSIHMYAAIYMLKLVKLHFVLNPFECYVDKGNNLICSHICSGLYFALLCII
jgi:hypothetical protein